MIRVVNHYTHQPTDSDIYIGRGTALGTPYTSTPLQRTKAKFQTSSRTESIVKYKQYLHDKLCEDTEKSREIKKQLKEITDSLRKHGYVNLVCYCYPKSCHGDVIKEYIETKQREI